MLKKTIEYTIPTEMQNPQTGEWYFEDQKVSEDFYFHLSKAELVELEMSVDGGLSETLKRIVVAEDAPSIIAEFKKIILGSYGQRSEDGKRFVKNQTLRDEFESSEAYSALFMELLTDTEAAVKFINGVVPSGMAEEAAKIARTETEPQLSVVPEDKPEPEKVSRAVLTSMSKEEFDEFNKRLQAGEAVIAD